MAQITGKIYQKKKGTENWFPRTVVEAVLGLNSYLQDRFDSLANIYMPLDGTGVSSIDSLMYFDTSNGRIGIGISTPLYNLDVAGTFHAAGNVEIGGTLTLRTNPSILHSIVSYGEVEIDSETELTLNCFDIDEDGNAAFEMVSVRDSLRLRHYDVDERDFSDSEVSFDGDHVSFVNPLSAPRYDTSSDQRLKTNLSPVALTVEQIASAPAVEFNWVGNGQRGAGSIAQYWEAQLPYNVHRNGDMLTMEYGNIALISAIVCARKIQELEEQVKKLEEKIYV